MDSKFVTVAEMAEIRGTTTQAIYKLLKKKEFAKFVFVDATTGKKVVSTDIFMELEKRAEMDNLQEALQPLATAEKALEMLVSNYQAQLEYNQKLQTELQGIKEQNNQLQTEVVKLQTELQTMAEETRASVDELNATIKQMQQLQKEQAERQAKGFFARLFGK